MTHNSKTKPKIGITLGDPCGIGPEITAKSLSNPDIKGLADFVIIGDRAVYDHYIQHDDTITFHDHALITSFDSPKDIPAERGAASYAYLQTCIDMLKNNTIQGIVTAPVNKRSIMASGIHHFCGHTEMFAQAFNIKRVEMMFVGGPYKTIIATRHIPLDQITSDLTADTLYETIQIAYTSLTKTFHLDDPKIALCGINPHAGEGGKIGNDEDDIIIPTIKKCEKDGITVSGPYAADTLFIPFNAKKYDLIIAMYHDQGLTPIKAMFFTELVNYTVGLPFVRTSTAHGTAENIAGQNIADPSSMTAAIKLACQLTAQQS